jgi:hypothetical protein
MPKVRDLGVTVVPEGFGPVEMGQGAGCGCTNVTNPCLLCTQSVTVCGGGTRWAAACAGVSTCSDCTTQPYSICGTTPGGCTDCTTTPYSICGTTKGGCSDCTTVPYSICGTTPATQVVRGGGCTDCTTQAYSICGTTPGPCTDCTTTPYSICGTTKIGCTDCTTQAFSICGTTPGGGAQKCTDCTNVPFSICGTSPMQPPQRGLTQEHINQLRTQLNAQLAALDAHEKALLPQSEEEIDAREKDLNSQLDKLRARRDEIKKPE